MLGLLLLFLSENMNSHVTLAVPRVAEVASGSQMYTSLAETDHKGYLSRVLFLFSARSCVFSSSASMYLYFGNLARFSVTCARVTSFDTRLIPLVKVMLKVFRRSATHVRQIFLARLLPL